VFSLRCTKKLLDRMRATPEPDPPEPSTILGDWYANLLYTPAGQLILTISERTLLPVLIPAVDAKSLPARVSQAVADALRAIGIPPGAVDRELAEMSQVTVAKTASRIVLGSMNDFAFMLDWGLNHRESLSSAAAFLANSPCKPIGMESPLRATKAAFAETVH
jgi:hypothetical protein